VRILLGVVLSTAVLAGCSASDAPEPKPAPLPTAVPPALQLPDHPTSDVWRGLALVPADAEVVTLTDLDQVRVRFGVPDLSGEDTMTERSAFWERADRDASLLTGGVLRPEASRLWLDHGISEDDVDWEVHFTGPSRSGYVVAFRPDLDMRRVRGALNERSLRGARLMADQHLLVKGTAEDGERVWASEPTLPELTDDKTESAYLRRGCVPVRTALGDDATPEDVEALLAKQNPHHLRPLEAFSVSFIGEIVTARIGGGRIDLLDRADLSEVWPRTDGDALTFRDGFAGEPVDDPSTGRIGYRVANPPAAAAVTLEELLPFAVCNDVVPIEEPSGP
jgi:hypothetical protein